MQEQIPDGSLTHRMPFSERTQVRLNQTLFAGNMVRLNHYLDEVIGMLKHDAGGCMAYDLSGFFGGFRYFSSLMLAGILSSLLIILGLNLLVIPGIYLAVAYSITPLFVVLAGLQSWESTEVRRQVISKNWFGLLGFFFVTGLINLAGVLALGIGVFITLPVSCIAVFCTYNYIFGIV